MFQADRQQILDSCRWQPQDGLLGYIEASKVGDGGNELATLHTETFNADQQ